MKWWGRDSSFSVHKPIITFPLFLGTLFNLSTLTIADFHVHKYLLSFFQESSAIQLLISWITISLEVCIGIIIELSLSVLCCLVVSWTAIADVSPVISETLSSTPCIVISSRIWSVPSVTCVDVSPVISEMLSCCNILQDLVSSISNLCWCLACY